MALNTSQSRSARTELPFIVAHKAASLAITALVILLVAVSAWWQQVYTSPRRVFWGMISNNLSTQSVTRSTTSGSTEAPALKQEQISFVPQMASRTLVTVAQKGANNTKVVSESVGTTINDYSRYLTIDTDQKGAKGAPLNYTPLLGVWGKSSPGAAQNFQQASLGLLPFANLSGSDSRSIIEMLENNKVYDADFAKASSKQISGRRAMTIPVKINTAAYVDVLKKLAKLSGISDTKNLRAEDYKDAVPIQLTLTIDTISRQLIEVSYTDSGQVEKYSNYGLSTPVVIPEKSIAIDELQQRLQEVQ